MGILRWAEMRFWGTHFPIACLMVSRKENHISSDDPGVCSKETIITIEIFNRGTSKKSSIFNVLMLGEHRHSSKYLQI